MAAAIESIEFVQEHLAEIAMDNRYATLPLWSKAAAEADARWQFTPQVTYAKTQTGELTIDGAPPTVVDVASSTRTSEPLRNSPARCVRVDHVAEYPAALPVELYAQAYHERPLK